jgi:hypothetical protein
MAADWPDLTVKGAMVLVIVAFFLLALKVGR